VDAVISQRELRNDSGAIMRRVAEGERFVVTRNGVPIADLVPHRQHADTRRRWVPVADLAEVLDGVPAWGADQFRDELAELDELLNDEIRDPWQRRG
jgi:prevent-host-death family protein